MPSSRERSRRWIAKNRKRVRLRAFGISLGQYAVLVEKQNGRCVICGNEESRSVMTSSGKRIASLSLDHCHATGKVRGLLCYRCNTLLGAARDNVKLLQEAIKYLETADTGFRKSDHAPVEIDSDALLTELTTEGDSNG